MGGAWALASSLFSSLLLSIIDRCLLLLLIGGLSIIHTRYYAHMTTLRRPARRAGGRLVVCVALSIIDYNRGRHYYRPPQLLSLASFLACFTFSVSLALRGGGGGCGAGDGGGGRHGGAGVWQKVRRVVDAPARHGAGG